jgi:hypothetical protein
MQHICRRSGRCWSGEAGARLEELGIPAPGVRAGRGLKATWECRCWLGGRRAGSGLDPGPPSHASTWQRGSAVGGRHRNDGWSAPGCGGCARPHRERRPVGARAAGAVAPARSERSLALDRGPHSAVDGTLGYRRTAAGARMALGDRESSASVAELAASLRFAARAGAARTQARPATLPAQVAPGWGAVGEQGSGGGAGGGQGVNYYRPGHVGCAGVRQTMGDAGERGCTGACSVQWS